MVFRLKLELMSSLFIVSASRGVFCLKNYVRGMADMKDNGR